MKQSERKKLEANVRFKNTKAFLEHGMIDLIEATKQINSDYSNGLMPYDYAIEAIKILSRIKTPA